MTEITQPTAEQITKAAALLGIPVGGVSVATPTPKRAVTVLLAELGAGVNRLQCLRDIAVDGLTQPEMAEIVAATEKAAASGDVTAMLNSALLRLHLAMHTVLATGDSDTRVTVRRLIGAAGKLVQCHRRGTDHGPNLEVVEIAKARRLVTDAVSRIDLMLPPAARRTARAGDRIRALIKHLSQDRSA